MAPEPFTLLIVDDEPELCNLISFRFESEGYRVFTAYSGEEALEVIAENRVDGILSDIRMNEGDGVSILESMKDLGESAPLVFLMTGYSSHSEQELIAKGAAAVFGKPFQGGKAIQKITELLANSRKKTAA